MCLYAAFYTDVEIKPVILVPEMAEDSLSYYCHDIVRAFLPTEPLHFFQEFVYIVMSKSLIKVI